MSKHDLTSNDLYLQDRNINGQHPAKYALYFIFWLVILSSLMGAVT